MRSVSFASATRRNARCGVVVAGTLLLFANNAILPAQGVQPSGELPSAPQAAATGSIAGLATDPTGAPIEGAEAILATGSPADSTLARTVKDGTFQFTGLTAGAYKVTVVLSGFVPVTRDVELAAGARVELPDIVLKLDTVHITVNAIMPEQMAAIELHEEAQQRFLAVLPNFYVSYNWQAYPLTARQKFYLATRNASDPGNLALSGLVAGVQQASNAFPGYGQGAAGYGKRFGADLANLVVGTYLGGAVLPSLFHQDPRYFYKGKGKGTIRQRFFYSISRAVITRGDNGRPQPNYSGVLGDLSASALSNLYYPASDRQGARLFAVNGVLAIAGDAMNGFVQEFVLPRLTTHSKK